MDHVRWVGLLGHGLETQAGTRRNEAAGIELTYPLCHPGDNITVVDSTGSRARFSVS